MSVCNLTLDVASQPLAPADHIPLMKMAYSAAIIEDKFTEFNGISWFNAEVKVMELTGDIKISQALTVRFKDYVNRLSTTEITDVSYKDGPTCPPELDVDCEPGCISTTDSWRTCVVQFNKKYRIGATWCVETERLTYGDLEDKFREQLRNSALAQSVVAWNELVCQAIAEPADTVNPVDAACFPTHYIEAGLASANGYKVLTDVIAYMKAMFGQGVDYAAFAHRFFEKDILSQDSTLHNYANTGIPTAWGNVDQLVQGGWKPMPALPGGLWGEKILIAPDMVDFYNADGTNSNPFLNEDATKYYVVIASKRSFYTGVTPLMDMTHFPATCDNKNESIQQTWLGFSKVLIPNEVFVIAFDVVC